jgi:Sulfotransferase family
MFISPSRKVAFIHIQKTGGSTIESVLGEHIPDFQIRGHKHNSVKYGFREIDDWESYFSFAFVRNPWDRLVSWYSMIEEAGRIKLVDTLNNKRNYNRYQYARKLFVWKEVLENTNSFDEFVRSATDIAITTDGRKLIAQNQIDYISDAHGNIVVNFIGRFENFQADLRQVLEKLEITLEPTEITRNRKNRSEHRHYSHYYTPETRAIVEQVYQRDIKYFGYTFEEG